MSTQAPEASPLLEDVSRETRERLSILAAEVRRWQRVRNLVATSTLDTLWTRHIEDSLQLAPLATGQVWVDLGSGGGFPGLVVAIVRPDLHVHLIESDSRKCAFLRHAARETRTSVAIHEGRIEAMLDALKPRPSIISARALATLSSLIEFAQKPLMAGAVGIFPKGKDYAAELTRAAERWRFAADLLPSRTNPEARILRIRDFAGRQHSFSAERP